MSRTKINHGYAGGGQSLDKRNSCVGINVGLQTAKCDKEGVQDGHNNRLNHIN